MRVPLVFHTILATILILAIGSVAYAMPLPPVTVELQDYLIVATGDMTPEELDDVSDKARDEIDFFEAFNFNGGELGANQEVVSSGTGGATTQKVRSYTDIGLDLTGTFVETDGATPFNSNNRWSDADPDFNDGDFVGTPDYLPGARPLFEPPDQSGNVAIIGANAAFVSENADFHASLGIKCGIDDADLCYKSDDKDNSYFPNLASTGIDLGTGPGEGVSLFDPTTLSSELSDWQTFIDSLEADITFTGDIENESYKDGGTPFVTDLDAIDANNGHTDGFAVIDITPDDGTFLLNNSDWILTSQTNSLSFGTCFFTSSTCSAKNFTAFSLLSDTAPNIPSVQNEHDAAPFSAVYIPLLH